MTDAATGLENEVKSIIAEMNRTERAEFNKAVADAHEYPNPDYVRMLLNDEHRNADRILPTCKKAIIEMGEAATKRWSSMIERAKRLRA